MVVHYIYINFTITMGRGVCVGGGGYVCMGVCVCPSHQPDPLRRTCM